MRGQQLDVHERESAARQRPGRGRDRVVLEVLVVDRVVLVLLDQGQQVLHLDGDPAVVGDQGAQPLGEPDHVGDVRVHVVGHDQVRRAVLGADGRAGVRAQELRERGHTRVPRRGADVHRRLDAEAADPAVHHVPAAGTRRCSRPRPRRRRGRDPAAVRRRRRTCARAPPRRSSRRRSTRTRVNVSSGVISGGICASQQSVQTRRCSGYAGSGWSSWSAARKLSHGGVAPRSTTLASAAEPQSRHRVIYCPHCFRPRSRRAVPAARRTDPRSRCGTPPPGAQGRRPG